VVRSVGWNIYVQDESGSDATALLPSVNQTIDWVRLAQRFPVRIQVFRTQSGGHWLRDADGPRRFDRNG
jgi:multidrug resistance efflux pump